ncbi:MULTISPECIES: Imm52 family immunity protein [unclassified Halomonas]|uniref:Imm52 family immunity protein n=1 Tax=unclassified Halomonas TaxID=2609666 RepID=UPI001C99C92F|nr:MULTISPECIES: Imm52 family immunity protein [unclassified Halomonas]MBY5942401.1 immunity 52 family protein [Halomonas sp. DP5N14-9]MCJ8286116.1 immunity 52 family protein [Halomonas sp.]NQY71168.1 immunity 52 family protein [Halomonas sp.]
MLEKIHVTHFFIQDMNYSDPDSVYVTWMDFNNSIRGIDHALKDWYYLAKATPDTVVYLNPINDKEQIIYSSIRKMKLDPIPPRENIKGISFHAWSQKVPARGPANEREGSLIAFSSLSGGTKRRPARFNLEIGLLQDHHGRDEVRAFAKICKAIARSKAPVWLSACPLSYMDHLVFPHRAHVGWMAVVPDVDISGQLPFLAYDEYLPDVGTLIVTTEERFDTTKPEHVEKSQMTETTLQQMGLLPEH